MTDTRLHPVTVANYSPSLIADAIRHVTGWSQKSEVLDKRHLTYLSKYLAKLNPQTIVIENEYIDRHYMEDYVEYYARCFHQHSRTCSRIHFFKNTFWRGFYLWNMWHFFWGHHTLSISRILIKSND